MGITLVVQWLGLLLKGASVGSLVGALRSCEPLSTTPYPKKIGTDTSEKKYTNDHYIHQKMHIISHLGNGSRHVTMCSNRAHSHHSAEQA